MGLLFNSPALIASESIFTTVGTSSFTIPNNIFSIGIVCVGGGGGGGGCFTGTGGVGGGGGALAWKNNINVAPDDLMCVVVGGGGTYGSGSAAPTSGEPGFASFVTSSNIILCSAGGGLGGSGSASTGAKTGAAGGTAPRPSRQALPQRHEQRRAVDRADPAPRRTGDLGSGQLGAIIRCWAAESSD